MIDQVICRDYRSIFFLRLKLSLLPFKRTKKKQQCYCSKISSPNEPISVSFLTIVCLLREGFFLFSMNVSFSFSSLMKRKRQREENFRNF